MDMLGIDIETQPLARRRGDALAKDASHGCARNRPEDMGLGARRLDHLDLEREASFSSTTR